MTVSFDNSSPQDLYQTEQHYMNFMNCMADILLSAQEIGLCVQD
jgi:hypothetical protein